MATQTIVKRVSDLDGGPADENIVFSIDGATFEIDLSAPQAGDLRRAFSIYVANARRLRGAKVTQSKSKAITPAASSSASSNGSVRIDRSAVREWARQNGHELADRGRIPTAVLDAYRQANPTAA